MKDFIRIAIASLLILSLSRVSAQSLKEAIREAIESLDVVEDVTKDSGCRETVLDLVAGCAVSLFPGLSILRLLSDVVNIRDGGVALDSEVLVTSLEKFNEDEDEVLSAEECCNFVCAMSRDACLCDEDTYLALESILGEDTVDILKLFRDTCLADNDSLSFDLTISDTESCKRRAIENANDYECTG